MASYRRKTNETERDSRVKYRKTYKMNAGRLAGRHLIYRESSSLSLVTTLSFVALLNVWIVEFLLKKNVEENTIRLQNKIITKRCLSNTRLEHWLIGWLFNGTSTHRMVNSCQPVRSAKDGQRDTMHNTSRKTRIYNFAMSRQDLDDGQLTANFVSPRLSVLQKK